MLYRPAHTVSMYRVAITQLNDLFFPFPVLVHAAAVTSLHGVGGDQKGAKVQNLDLHHVAGLRSSPLTTLHLEEGWLSIAIISILIPL